MWGTWVDQWVIVVTVAVTDSVTIAVIVRFIRRNISIAVIIEAVAEFGGIRMHGGVTVVTVTWLRRVGIARRWNTSRDTDAVVVAVVVGIQPPGLWG